MNDAIRAAHAADVGALLRDVRGELFERIMPFWSGAAVDHEQGGWMAWLSNDLTPDRSQPKGLVVHSRILWTFSAAHAFRADPLHRRMACRAYDYLMTRFWDQRHGGGFWWLDDHGRMLDPAKRIYGQAFMIFALAEFHRAFGCTAALARAQQLFELIERHAHDDKFGGYAELRRRDWASERPAWQRIIAGRHETKTMNDQLHLLEAFTNLFRVAASPLLERRLRELVGLFLRQILDTRSNHLRQVFDRRWRPRSEVYSFGHDIEASWLLCEAAAVLRDLPLLAETRAAALRLAAVARDEGLGSDGGLYHEGRPGEVTDRSRVWWPQAEALVGFINAFQLSGDVGYLRAGRGVWAFIANSIVDREHGDWFCRIGPDGVPDPTQPKVSVWKGPYHSARACLEVLRRLAPAAVAPPTPPAPAGAASVQPTA